MRTVPITGICLLMLSMSCCMGHPAPLMPVSDLVIERLNNNYLPLDSCEVTTDGNTIRYRFIAKDCMCSSGALIICTDCGFGDVTVNGREVKAVKGLHQLGPGDGCYFLDDRLQSGENVVELQRSPMSGDAEVPAMYVAGDFSVEQASGGMWNLQPAKVLDLGSWGGQGLPFYTWEVSYSRSYVFPEKAGKRILRLGEWKGSACEVYVNWEKAGVISKKPYIMNIGPFLKPGQNEIEVRCIGNGDSDCGLYEEFTIE